MKEMEVEIYIKSLRMHKHGNIAEIYETKFILIPLPDCPLLQVDMDLHLDQHLVDGALWNFILYWAIQIQILY